MKFILTTILLITVVSYSSASPKIEGKIAPSHSETIEPSRVCFSPDENCGQELLEFTASATKSIDVAVYDINLEALVDLLIEKSKHIPVRILVDKRQSKGPHSLVSLLQSSHVNLRYGHQRGIMHNKFIIFGSTLDERNLIWNGSYNFTSAASYCNQENVSVSDHGESTSKFYDEFLRKVYDYPETASELLANAIQWIDDLKPKLSESIHRVAKILNLDEKSYTISDIETAISKNKKYLVPPNELIPRTEQLRTILLPFVNKYVVSVPPKYDVKIIPSPSYLGITTAAALWYNQLLPNGDAPNLLYLVNIDPKLSPMSNMGAVLNIWTHEEMGHDINAFDVSQNKSLYFADKLENSFLGPISEGISFHRESQVLDAIIKYRSQDADVDALLTPELLEFATFATYRNQMIRYLRVVGDVVLNSDVNTLPEFLQWAEENTGIDGKTMYYQLFPLHEASGAGYATAYAVVGNKLADIDKHISTVERKIEFNNAAASMGWLPTSIFLSRLNVFKN